MILKPQVTSSYFFFCLEKEIGNSSFKHFCKFYFEENFSHLSKLVGSILIRGLQYTVVDPLLLAMLKNICAKVNENRLNI